MKNYLIHLLNYEAWANKRVIQALETLDAPPARAVQVMGHILSAQQIWIGRVTKEPTFVAIWEDIPIAWMAEMADRQHRKLVNHITNLAETELLAPIDYVTSKDQPFQNTVLDILTHMSHHSAYHRGQVVQLVRQMLPDAPVTDFIVWVRE
ncbi:damage-inducible protein DinB [Fibrisoma montanum]|uniref:Damage-inducible protein DinB n=1 Tax=Fibrisoma montanum TaxID=2305895 RepID=A0A418LYL9_9BACT|nr:DinB family protein [Fibrisoma montanum]RIV18454.1 damage-inducible protein DinB [Fibrisoma montanum]